MDIKEKFKLKYTNENTNKLKLIIQELKEAKIGLHNFRNWNEKVLSYIMIIDSQIESSYSNYSKICEDHIETISDPKISRLIKEEKLVPEEIYNYVINGNHVLQEMISWYLIRIEINNLIYNNIYTLLDQVNAMSIQKDAMKELKDMIEKRNDFYVEVINSRLLNYDNKIMNNLVNMQKTYKLEIKEHMSDMNRFMSNITDKFISVLKETKKNTNLNYMPREKSNIELNLSEKVESENLINNSENNKPNIIKEKNKKLNDDTSKDFPGINNTSEKYSKFEDNPDAIMEMQQIEEQEELKDINNIGGM